MALSDGLDKKLSRTVKFSRGMGLATAMANKFNDDLMLKRNIIPDYEPVIKVLPLLGQDGYVNAYIKNYMTSLLNINFVRDSSAAFDFHLVYASEDTICVYNAGSRLWFASSMKLKPYAMVNLLIIDESGGPYQGYNGMDGEDSDDSGEQISTWYTDVANYNTIYNKMNELGYFFINLVLKPAQANSEVEPYLKPLGSSYPSSTEVLDVPREDPESPMSFSDTIIRFWRTQCRNKLMELNPEFVFPAVGTPELDAILKCTIMYTKILLDDSGSIPRWDIALSLNGFESFLTSLYDDDSISYSRFDWWTEYIFLFGRGTGAGDGEYWVREFSHAMMQFASNLSPQYLDIDAELAELVI